MRETYVIETTIENAFIFESMPIRANAAANSPYLVMFSTLIPFSDLPSAVRSKLSTLEKTKPNIPSYLAIYFSSRKSPDIYFKGKTTDQNKHCFEILNADYTMQLLNAAADKMKAKILIDIYPTDNRNHPYARNPYSIRARAIELSFAELCKKAHKLLCDIDKKNELERERWEVLALDKWRQARAVTRFLTGR